MKKILYFFALIILTLSCGRDGKSTSKTLGTPFIADDSLMIKNDIRRINSTNINPYRLENSIDSLIRNYITYSNNDLIKLSRKTKIQENWLFDQKINTDTATYYRFEIGHDVSDSSGKELRFVTDTRIYIDSLTKEVYEYNVSDDSLIEWNK